MKQKPTDKEIPSRPSFPPNMIKEGGDNVPLIIGYAFVASLLITFVIYLISNF
jgi:hypothetical protein